MSTEIHKDAIPLASSDQCNSIYTKLKILRKAKNVSVGINEVTKKLNEGKAQLVVIAGDVDPFEITMTLPIICEEKDVTFIHVRSKEALGAAVNLEKAAASVIFYTNEQDRKRNENIIKELKIKSNL